MFFNTTNEIGMLLNAATENLTGSMTLTLIALLLVVAIIFFALRVPAEVTLALLLPFLIVIMAFESALLAVFGVIIIGIGILFAIYFFM